MRDSEASNIIKYISWTNLKAAILSYLNSLQAPKTLADAAPVDIDVSDGSTRAALSTASSRELNFSASGERDMQVLTLRIDNTSGSAITPTLNTSGASDGRFGSDFTALPTIAAGKTAYLTFIYNDPDDRWDYLGDTKGF